uniref:C-type lectin domain-containing protein n=2 Tax=Ciona intestinalis TaxID=7719 RepID=F6Q1U9_CIOIN
MLFVAQLTVIFVLSATAVLSQHATTDNIAEAGSCHVSAVCSSNDSISNVNIPLRSSESNVELEQIHNVVLRLHQRLNETIRHEKRKRRQQDAMLAVLKSHLRIVEVRVKRIERTLSLDHLRTTLGDYNRGWYDGGNGYEYKIRWDYIALSYDDARASCENMGAKIATVGVRQQQTFNALKKLFRKSSLYTYIGLTDRENEGVWVWDDGRLAKHYWTNWLNVEPNDSRNNEYQGEDCAFITAREPYQWNDTPCYNPAHVLCERPTTRQ